MNDKQRLALAEAAWARAQNTGYMQQDVRDDLNIALGPQPKPAVRYVVITSRGGFGVSRAGVLHMRELGSQQAKNEPLHGEPGYDRCGPDIPADSILREEYNSYLHDVSRDDAILVQTVLDIGEAANGEHARSLCIVEIPADVVFQICESEMGGEWIAEKHRTWFSGPRMPDTEKSIIDRFVKSSG